MRNNDDIPDIIRQLDNLQLQQDGLLLRLVELTNPASREPRPFVIGDLVRIANPGPSQPTTGRITKIGKERITVTAQSGKKIIRVPKNLILE